MEKRFVAPESARRTVRAAKERTGLASVRNLILLGVLLAGSITGVMPWILSFAAGAMIYVVVEELIPEAHLGEHSHSGTLGVIAGFVIMMVLDTALG